MLTLDGVITSVLRSEIGSKILRRHHWKFIPPSYHFAFYLATEPGESVLRAWKPGGMCRLPKSARRKRRKKHAENMNRRPLSSGLGLCEDIAKGTP